MTLLVNGLNLKEISCGLEKEIKNLLDISSYDGRINCEAYEAIFEELTNVSFLVARLSSKFANPHWNTLVIKTDSVDSDILYKAFDDRKTILIDESDGVVKLLH